ncbi:DMT family transporter [Candidatus Poribacteria bacterium]|nr:DMT family transporter [Candidatus Poribacteria bacterium]
MAALVLHILFTSGFGLGLKGAIQRRLDMAIVGGVNYVVAALCGLIWVSQAGIVIGVPGVAFGTINGLCYFAAYFALLQTIFHHGVSIARAVGQLAILIPLAFSILVWGEYPSVGQAVGMVVGIGALLLMNVRRDPTGSTSLAGVRIALFAYLALSGSARLVAKVFAEAGAPDEKPVYVVIAFIVTAVASIYLFAKGGRTPTWTELAWGAGIGICNMVQIAFFLAALEQLPGIVVFPAAACGALVVTAVVAIAFLGERPTARHYVGIAASTLAVVLLYWRTPPH